MLTDSNYSFLSRARINLDTHKKYMKTIHLEVPRVMAISIASGRVGYAVLEGPQFLIDWGVLDVRGVNDKERISKIVETIAWNLPDILVLEDVKAKGCMKGARSRVLIKRIKSESSLRAIDTVMISRMDVRCLFAPLHGHNKDVIARTVANHFPELLRALPRERRPWDAEQYRMTLFEAASYALVYFSREA